MAQNYMTGVLPQAGVDYQVGNPLTLGMDANLITTTFGALCPNGDCLHYGIDFSLRVKKYDENGEVVKNSNGEIQYEYNDSKQIYPLLSSDSTTVKTANNGLGGNTVVATTTVAYNFR